MKGLKKKAHMRGLFENSLFCIFMIFDDVFLMPETIAIEYCFSMSSEDRDDHDQIEHYAHTDPGHRCQIRTPFMVGLSYIAPPLGT